MNDSIQILLNTLNDFKNELLEYVNEKYDQQEIADFIEKKFYEILGIWGDI